MKKRTLEDEIREDAENTFESFVRLVQPKLLYGSIHSELMQWMTRTEAKQNQLVLLPRGHLKSKIAAIYTAWCITTNPAVTILYVSATAALAVKQLYDIKNILDSRQYRRYWPEMINKDEGKREKWTESEISVDHPKRKEEGIRDATCLAVGLTTNVTGFHADIVILDDLVVPGNAYTEEGREKVLSLYSHLASIENPNAREIAVGTRYFARDIYNNMITMVETIYSDDGEELEEENVYEVFERVVEENSEFLWPRSQRSDGKWYGFDLQVLSRIKAKYQNPEHFYAQYYNNPNAGEAVGIDRSKFQYYNKKHLNEQGGSWYFTDKKLNVYAAIDFAFSLKKKADFTALVTIGVDSGNNYYILEIDRFKTNKIVEYFNHILQAHQRWGFRKIRAEVSVAQKAIVEELKTSYIKAHGLGVSIDEYRPSRHEGDKEERMAAILEPKYDNMQVWHYQGGNCQLLEEELILIRPPHDDMKEALANAMNIAIAPRQRWGGMDNIVALSVHPKFGGTL